MSSDSILKQELENLELSDLKKVATLWNLPKLSQKDKSSSIQYLYGDIFQSEFYLKGVLEKLTSLQVTIYSAILKNKNVLTLGEISRKVNIPPINVEMELGVLRKHMLVYQRKNRERLTNNLDKYHAFEEIAKLVPVEQNVKGDKFQVRIEKLLEKTKPSEIGENWKKALDISNVDGVKKFYQTATSAEGFSKILQGLNELERDTISRVYQSGGVASADDIRNFLVLNRGKFDQTVPALLEKMLLIDVVFIDEKFVRVFILSEELLEYLQTNPILPSVKKGTRQRQETISTNELDFFLNTKKLISYISRKGIVLAKSGKVKQADHKRTEQELLNPDISIFPEKSQIYQMELILPVLKLLGLVDLKGENIILYGDTQEYLEKDIFDVMKIVIHEVNEARMRRVNPPEVFSATEMPFYDKIILDKCVSLILKFERIHLSVIFASIIREHLIFSPGFRTKNFENDLADLRKEIMSAVFYLHVFGLLQVEYPSRFLSLSELGHYFFQTGEISHETEKGGITINPDFTIIAFPDRVSLYGIHLLKAFTELKDYDRVYTFVLNKEAYQLGILLGYKPEEFINFLKQNNRAELAQNLLFLLDDWGSNLPVVDVTEDCVLVRTKDQNTMELLLGQIKGKKMVIDEISPTAILVDKNKVQDIIATSEKLNLIIKLTR